MFRAATSRQGHSGKWVPEPGTNSKLSAGHPGWPCNALFQGERASEQVSWPSLGCVLPKARGKLWIPDELSLEWIKRLCNTMEGVGEKECLRCGYRWTPRIPDRPKQCPHCKQQRWDIPVGVLKSGRPSMKTLRRKRSEMIRNKKS